MKKKIFLVGFFLVFILEIVSLIIFAMQTPNFSLDAIEVNEVVYSVTKDFYSLEEHENETTLDYVVLDNNGNIIYKTKSNLSESVNEAITNRDMLLNIIIDGEMVGKIIIYNDTVSSLQKQKQLIIIVLSIAIFINGIICIGYIVYIHFTMIRPFSKLKGFAERVTCGNLDIPLEMDKHNLFGAFTESFDIMRSELKKARISEAKANESKKELVAKLSHDIKTPVASIKAVSEVGLAMTNNEKDKINYSQIINKSDQINTLVTNLFSATLEELKKLTVAPTNIESKKVKTLLENADYLHRAIIPNIPECLVYVDSLRLQQVFDNIFANSYKYANTKITIEIQKNEKYIDIIIEDFGGGVLSEELPILIEKYKRGSNSVNTDGAGLGLYISDFFMKEMEGKLKVENGMHGLKVIVSLCLSGKN